MQLTAKDIAALPQRERAQLINCLPGFKPAVLVGTVDAQAQTNLAIISSLFHVGAAPPLLGMILRPAPEGVERHTLENILETEQYTLNGFRIEQAALAHQTSARFARHESEFERCGFTEQYVKGFRAPFVSESPLKIGCQLREHQCLAINQTHLIIGEITHLSLPDNALREDGSIDLNAMRLATVTGLDSYHGVETGERYRYAKPDCKPQPVND